MRIKALAFILILLGAINISNAQESDSYENEFKAAYLAYPNVPKGILEAVAFSQTRITDIEHPEHSCIGLPEVEGVMGLVIDGHSYFKNTQSYVANTAGIPLLEMGEPANDIMGYAAAYNSILTELSMTIAGFAAHELVLRQLSEIPSDGNAVNEYALSSFTYQVLDFLRDEEQQATFQFQAHPIDLKLIYGEANLKILSSKKVTISEETVINSKGDHFTPQNKSLEYGPALWVATPACNYSSRSGTAISAVTVHTIQGSYAGAISWAQNCNANVSYHYVVRSTDGQVTQMVYEADKGWHVGNANPYCIGIEHEGYVDNPAWLTTSLYTSSANLTKDITQSGYGINPLRTYFGPSSTGTNTLGACTTIKGHQHFANQSHTDPGINWDWEYYYQLINDAPPITTLTSVSGVTYDSGGAGGNYMDDERELYLIEPVGVQSVTISFDQFNIEQDWDYLYVYDGSSLSDALLGVYTGTANPGSITSSGGAILLEFRSDCATPGIGWEISWTSIPGPNPGDLVAPSTSISISNTWKTTNFMTTFTDLDNAGGSGVHHKLYQVIDFDGTEWRANNNNGFFSDNFDVAIHPDWTSQVGTWGINASVLNQSDDANTNTNLWASLNQDNYDKWMYNFSAKISGAGANKRAGFHFMCDDPALENRGNSYFVWLRSDDDKVQIYKTVNDIFSLEQDLTYTINDDQWYDWKVVFDKTTGKMEFYLDHVLIASWVDPSPYTAGNSISLRTGDAVMEVNNLKVYHNRGNSELVTITAGNDIQYQNSSPLVHAAKVKSIAIDSSNNISSIAEQLVNVDWTPSTSIPSINDGLAADVATFTNNTEISANWLPSNDPNSDLQRYWYAIGTSFGAIDIVGWTDNWNNDTVTHSGLTLIEGVTYYFSVFAENGAGLFSDTIYSDGQLLAAPTATPDAGFIISNAYICSFEPVLVQNSSQDAQTYAWDAPGATPSASADANPTFAYTATGYYDITLTASGVGGTDTETQTIYVSIDTIPVAAYTTTSATVDISNAFVTFYNESEHANGYFWDFNDGAISTDASPWHEFTELGAYNVVLVAVNGNCPNDTTYSTIQVIDDLGMDIGLGQTEVFPNPVKEELTIKLDQIWGEQVQIELLDARGRIVFKQSYQNQGTIQLNLIKNGVNEGVYFLRLSNDKKVGSQKIIVERT